MHCAQFGFATTPVKMLVQLHSNFYLWNVTINETKYKPFNLSLSAFCDKYDGFARNVEDLHSIFRQKITGNG